MMETWARDIVLTIADFSEPIRFILLGVAGVLISVFLALIIDRIARGGSKIIEPIESQDVICVELQGEQKPYQLDASESKAILIVDQKTGNKEPHIGSVKHLVDSGLLKKGSFLIFFKIDDRDDYIVWYANRRLAKKLHETGVDQVRKDQQRWKNGIYELSDEKKDRFVESVNQRLKQPIDKRYIEYWDPKNQNRIRPTEVNRPFFDLALEYSGLGSTEQIRKLIWYRMGTILGAHKNGGKDFKKDLQHNLPKSMQAYTEGIVPFEIRLGKTTGKDSTYQGQAIRINRVFPAIEDQTVSNPGEGKTHSQPHLPNLNIAELFRTIIHFIPRLFLALTGVVYFLAFVLLTMYSFHYQSGNAVFDALYSGIRWIIPGTMLLLLPPIFKRYNVGSFFMYVVLILALYIVLANASLAGCVVSGIIALIISGTMTLGEEFSWNLSRVISALGYCIAVILTILIATQYQKDNCIMSAIYLGAKWIIPSIYMLSFPFVIVLPDKLDLDLDTGLMSLLLGTSVAVIAIILFVIFEYTGLLFNIFSTVIALHILGSLILLPAFLTHEG